MDKKRIDAVNGLFIQDTELRNDVLKKDNTEEYTPVNNYNPATKKYADDKISSIINNNVSSSTTTYSSDTIDKMFAWILSEAAQAGYLKPEAVFIDGTHIKANANTKKKIENATLYIKEIDQHKKSLFDFWKFANKDEVLELDNRKHCQFIDCKCNKNKHKLWNFHDNIKKKE